LTREVSDRAFCAVEGYGVDAGQWRAVECEETDAGTLFRVLRRGRPFGTFVVPAPGAHNVRNALAVVAAASAQRLCAEEIAAGLATYRGVRRRLELRGEPGEVRLFDDFAHHPTAIAETLGAVRGRHREARIWAVLEPRSWSMRRNVFQERLPAAFDCADDVIVAAVYAPESVPEPQRLDVVKLVADLRRRGRAARYLPDVDAIVSLLQREATSGDVVVVMSNGGFEGIHERLLAALCRRECGSRVGRGSPE
jgi:UDP-N-acetylmuramate: L-alanyl-gamma-D-glutamyl-meso-diaminopimelate ligase